MVFRINKLACFFLAAFAAAVLGSPSLAQNAGPIKIGLMLPYKGVYAPIADGIDRGFQIALEEYGNKVAGRSIEVIRADDELNPSVGVQKFNKFVQSDQVDLVAGVVGSNVGIAVSRTRRKEQDANDLRKCLCG